MITNRQVFRPAEGVVSPYIRAEIQDEERDRILILVENAREGFLAGGDEHTAFTLEALMATIREPRPVRNP